MSDDAWMIGRLRAGPFAVADKMDLLGLMARHGLHLSDPSLLMEDDAEPVVEVLTSPRGCTLVARGMSVRAYFLADDGLEVEREKLEDFLLEAAAPNMTVSIIGRHQATPDAVFLNSTQLTHDGDIVTWQENQMTSRTDEDIIIKVPTVSALDHLLSTSMG